MLGATALRLGGLCLLVLPWLGMVACSDARQEGPEGYVANKSKFWAENKLPEGQLVAFAGSNVRASAASAAAPTGSSVPLGTISASGAIKLMLPKELPFSNDAGGRRSYCSSGLDFEFHAGYACSSTGQDDTHRMRNACTNAPEASLQNIRLAAVPNGGEAKAVTTVAALTDSTSFPYALLVANRPTKINGCTYCFYIDEKAGLTTDRYTFVCYQSDVLPANTLLGVFRANTHEAADTLAVRVRPVEAADLKFLSIEGAP